MHSLDYSIGIKLNGLSAIYLEKKENKKNMDNKTTKENKKKN